MIVEVWRGINNLILQGANKQQQHHRSPKTKIGPLSVLLMCKSTPGMCVAASGIYWGGRGRTAGENTLVSKKRSISTHVISKRLEAQLVPISLASWLYLI